MANSDSGEASESWDYTPLPSPFPPIFPQGAPFTAHIEKDSPESCGNTGQTSRASAAHHRDTAVLEGTMASPAAIKNFLPTTGSTLASWRHN